ncbi:isochorismatase family cysteine hydrolase [Tateyamaria sp. ANG-S1]|uniref:cysteine hydrolase family protein n=1 Tax=Tateyamaria sp. ANG-S1 TaxID=1577905 RepID=UPI00057E6E7B|nr:isochorismatase family cysteine hydrolase [Tateyamaria sp. ANG-S1]KIC50027.1 isochorismatase [Tateyamaria sp. ANG-S1]
MTLVGYIAAAFALAAVLWLGVGIRRIGAVSQGDPIGNRSRTAVLMIDLQTVFWDHGPYADDAKAQAESAILNEVANAKAQGMPVIAMRQEWSIPSTKAIARLLMKGQAVAGTPGTELAAPFANLAEHILVKRVQDSFETGALEPLLADLNVGRLRLVGLDFNYCVLKTALAARQRGYDVEVITQGTLAAASTAKSEDRLRHAGVALG